MTEAELDAFTDKAQEAAEAVAHQLYRLNAPDRPAVLESFLAHSKARASGGETEDDVLSIVYDGFRQIIIDRVAELDRLTANPVAGNA